MYSSEIVRSSSFNVPNMTTSSKASITVASGTDFKVTIGNICGEDISVNVFTIGQTFTLEPNTTCTHTVEKAINCGKVRIEIDFAAGTNCINYVIRKIHDFKKSFVTTGVTGNTNFNATVMGSYSLAFAETEKATLDVKRNGIKLSEGTILHEGEELVVSATPSSYYVVNSIFINNTTYASGETVTVNSSMAVNGVITVGVNADPYVWETLYSGSYPLSNNGTLLVSGLQANTRTRFTTSAVTVEYTIGDICGNYSDTVSDTFSANTDIVTDSGSISGSFDNGVATYGYTLKAQAGSVKFTASATMNSYDEWTDLYLSGSSITIYKVEQMREP